MAVSHASRHVLHQVPLLFRSRFRVRGDAPAHQRQD
jgi:hypothetical protein